MTRQPQRPRASRRIDADFPPPCGFIATAVNFAMVSATQRNGELIADLAPECSGLRKSQMMGIRGLRPQIKQGCLATDLT